MILRRLRGVLVAAGLGAVGYGLFSAVVMLGLIGAGPPGTREGYLEMLSGMVLVGAATGAVLAAVFAIAVSLGERGRTVGTLSERRIKRWGALAGLVAFAVQFTAIHGSIPRGAWDWYMILVCGPIMGAGVAAGYLTLARRRRAAVESN